MESNWTAASVRNIRAQRKLELEFQDLDKLRNINLKNINHQRLGVIYDLNRYRILRRTVEYTSSTITGRELHKYTRKCLNSMLEQRVTQRRTKKYDFSLNASDKRNLRLPPIDVEIDPEKEEAVYELVTSSDLNRKRAVQKKGVNELEQLLVRTIGRKVREKRNQDDDDDDDNDDKEDSGQLCVDHPSSLKGLPMLLPDVKTQEGVYRSPSLLSSNVSLSIRSIISPRFLPMIREIL